MDEPSGLNWITSSTSPSNNNSQPNRNGDVYSSLRPTPPTLSRQPSPLSASGRKTPSFMPSASSGPSGQDSFAGLLGSNKKTDGLSLQEKQKQLIEEKRRQALGLVSGQNDPFNSNDAAFWEGLGSGRNTPAQAATVTPAMTSAGQPTEDEDDILAAFNSAAPVDKSSHFPAPQQRNGVSSSSSSRPQSAQTQRSQASARTTQPPAVSQPLFDADDDDPFGLQEMPRRAPARQEEVDPQLAGGDDDDVLGLLGKPVDDVPRPAPEKPRRVQEQTTSQPSSGMNDPRDTAVADLVDMGFDADKARRALDQTRNGIDVQGAVSWLLNSAHEEARNRSKAHDDSNGGIPDADLARPRPGQRIGDNLGDNRSRGRMPQDGPGRTDSQSPASREKDVSQVATEFGNQMWKSANTLWRTGQKKVQKAVHDFQQEGDNDGRPRWMTEAEMRQRQEEPANGQATRPSKATDEAAMLEPGQAPPSRGSRRSRQTDPETQPVQRRPPETNGAGPTPKAASRPAHKLSRQAVEEESGQAYISPARRKKATPVPEHRPTPQPPPAPSETEESMDIFSDIQPASLRLPTNTSRPSQRTPTTAKPSTSIPVRPKAAPRNIPSTSPTALQTSTTHRQSGTTAFKQGDYAAATTSYLAALQPLSPQHPITIILHTNLSLTHLKTGDAKAALSSATTALQLIGPSRGENEFIDLGPEGTKEMREYHAKSLTRKASALEHLERWSDAAAVWREAVEANIGGSIAIQGRNRCEKAAAPPSTSAAQPPAAKRAPPRPKPTPTPNQPPSSAVTALRAANAAATAASDEAFALNDSVSARIDAWKTGKEGNLRALLAGLDNVLWEGANWQKVGMGDLVLAGKVKVVYMRAIGRCHPDKIPQDATTEQKMVSASVFATLNEAWDRFKRDNGMA